MDEIIAAYRELGDTPEQAVESALRQFGSSQSVGRAWRQAAISTAPGAARHSTRVALSFFGLMCLPILAVRFDYLRNLEAHVGLLLYLSPLMAGVGTGFLASQRPVRGVLNTLALLFLPMTTLLAWGSATSGRGWWDGTLDTLLVFAISWAPLGCVSAGLGRWLRRQMQGQRQRPA